VSNALAISATTLTLQALLTQATPNVTTLPPDRARNGGAGDQLNLFLYQTLLNPAWRNMDLPRQVKSGETGHAPLPLNLHYLITAYGDNETDSHEVLGKAMSVLHDHTLLDAAEIRGATQVDLPESDLHQQLERIRITLLPLSVEEIFKLWSGFQTQYRLSAAYEISLVLIESTRPTRTPLPVLQRGKDDRGVTAVASAAPTLFTLIPEHKLPSAQLGSLLTLEGQNLNGDLTVRFNNFRLETPLELSPQAGGSSSQLQVRLPSGSPAISDWLAGFYTVSLVTHLPDLPAWTSNEVALGLAPTFTLSSSGASVGDTLTITCSPRLHPEQRALILFADQHLQPQTINTPLDTTQPSTLTFQVPNVGTGEYVVRLRVDGVDSLPFRLSGTPVRLQFDPNQKVVVT
jgi:Pvc16 N-terminal domain